MQKRYIHANATEMQEMTNNLTKKLIMVKNYSKKKKKTNIWERSTSMMQILVRQRHTRKKL